MPVRLRPSSFNIHQMVYLYHPTPPPSIYQTAAWFGTAACSHRLPLPHGRARGRRKEHSGFASRSALGNGTVCGWAAGGWKKPHAGLIWLRDPRNAPPMTAADDELVCGNAVSGGMMRRKVGVGELGVDGAAAGTVLLPPWIGWAVGDLCPRAYHAFVCGGLWTQIVNSEETQIRSSFDDVAPAGWVPRFSSDPRQNYLSLGGQVKNSILLAPILCPTDNRPLDMVILPYNFNCWVWNDDTVQLKPGNSEFAI